MPVVITDPSRHMAHYINLACKITGVLVGIACYAGLQRRSYRRFAGFLPVVVLSEPLAASLHLPAFHGVYWNAVANTLFYSLFFHSLYRDPVIRKTILTVCVLLTALFMLGYVFANDSSGMHFYTLGFIVTGMFFTVAGLGFLYARISDPGCIHLMAEADFWIVAGIVMFYSGNSVVFSFYGYIVQNDLLWLGEELYNTLPKLLSVPLYSGILAGILVAAAEKPATAFPETT
jgi:hypothetical protein